MTASKKEKKKAWLKGDIKEFFVPFFSLARQESK
jgi:hypothetical protein